MLDPGLWERGVVLGVLRGREELGRGSGEEGLGGMERERVTGPPLPSRA